MDATRRPMTVPRRLLSEDWIASVAELIIGPAKGRTRWPLRNDEIEFRAQRVTTTGVPTETR